MDGNLRTVQLLHVRGHIFGGCICRENCQEAVTVHAYGRSLVFCEMVWLIMAPWHINLGADATFCIYAVPRSHFANRVHWFRSQDRNYSLRRGRAINYASCEHQRHK